MPIGSLLELLTEAEELCRAGIVNGKVNPGEPDKIRCLSEAQAIYKHMRLGGLFRAGYDPEEEIENRLLAITRVFIPEEEWMHRIGITHDLQETP